MYGDASGSLRRCVRCLSAANASASISRRVSLLLIRSATSAHATHSSMSYIKIGQRLIFRRRSHRHNAGHVGKTKQQLQLLTWIRVDWRPHPYTNYAEQRALRKKTITSGFLGSNSSRRRAQEMDGPGDRPVFILHRSRKRHEKSTTAAILLRISGF